MVNQFPCKLRGGAGYSNPCKQPCCATSPGLRPERRHSSRSPLVREQAITSVSAPNNSLSDVASTTLLCFRRSKSQVLRRRRRRASRSEPRWPTGPHHRSRPPNMIKIALFPFTNNSMSAAVPGLGVPAAHKLQNFRTTFSGGYRSHGGGGGAGGRTTCGEPHSGRGKRFVQRLPPREGAIGIPGGSWMFFGTPHP